jgi:hypothetical protein
MLRSHAFARLAGEAVRASSIQNGITHLTRHLSLTTKLGPVSGIANSIARSFATKVVKRKTTTKAKAKTAVKKKKTPTKSKTKAKAKAKKPIAKKKTPVRKRKVVKKKAVVKPKRKAPSERQKLLAVQTKARDEIKKLKETALLSTVPKQGSTSAWMVYVTEKLKGATGGPIAETMKTSAAEFKALSASELEVYFSIAPMSFYHNLTCFRYSVTTISPTRTRSPTKKPIAIGSRATLPNKSDSPTMPALSSSAG